MTVTKLDVARYLNGEVTEDADMQRIEEAMIHDPKVERWVHELDLESMLPEEPEGETEANATELASWTRNYLDKLRRSELWRLELDQPLAGINEPGSQAQGYLVRAERHERHHLSCVVRRVGGQRKSFELKLTKDAWPFGYEPLQLLVGPISPAVLGGADEAVHEDPTTVSLPELRRRIEREEHAGVLAADDGEETQQKKKLTGKSGQFNWSLVEERGCLVEVDGPRLAARDERIVVVELGYQRGDQERPIPLGQAVLLSGRPDAERWTGSAHFRVLRDVADYHVTVNVEPLAENDLYLLDPANAYRLLLADQDVFSLHLSRGPSEGLFTFQLAGSQEELLAEDPEASSHLHLRVATPDEED